MDIKFTREALKLGLIKISSGLLDKITNFLDDTFIQEKGYLVVHGKTI